MKTAAHIRDAGFCCYSPIAHWHGIELIFPAAYNIYLRMDIIQLSHHDLLFVLCNNEWEKSYGIEVEITHAVATGIPVYYINLEGEISDDPGQFNNQHNQR